jgi:hypothetical protein
MGERFESCCSSLKHDKGNAAVTAAGEQGRYLLLEQDLKFDCEDCCTVAKNSLHVMRARENNGADTSDMDSDPLAKVILSQKWCRKRMKISV